MLEDTWPREPFGARRPGGVVDGVIRWLHHGPGEASIKRAVASLAKRHVIRRCDLPIDVEAGELRLRCGFTDNFCERKFVFTPWRYDRVERGLLEEHLPPDGVFLDIGANIGLYTLFAAALLDGRGRVLAFEPNPPTLARLRMHLDVNRREADWPAVEILPIGIADRERDLALHQHSSNLGACSLIGDGAAPSVHGVRCRPLLDVLRERAITRTDVLKIDIEGAEDVALAPFLTGAENEMLPRLILLEDSSAVWQRDLFAMMRERGDEEAARTARNGARLRTGLAAGG
jgi:FkbM family methyltransferase